MKAPLSWLKEYVDIDVDVNTLCEKLVSIGWEVEELTYLGEGIRNVVVGKVLDITKHPNADRLRVCQVDIGGGKVIQIVTGAQNVMPGDVVPVALDDSDLPCGKHIVRGELRGVDSNGMLCGGSELGINNDIFPNAEFDGICILDKNEKIGQNIVDTLHLNDYVLDVSITSNRPDCGSVHGLAREVAVALGKKCKPIDTEFAVNSQTKTVDMVSVQVKATDLCPNYYMQTVENVKIAPSPLWMRRRLAFCGLRGINNLVDITNYVLLELGQPMHAFDYALLEDKTIVVRRANNDEKIVPLDGKEYVLNDNVLVIADKHKAVGLAGIMGGSNSAISQNTTSVAFEAAKFLRENIRHNSRKLGIRSDSSARFEKGIDAYTAKMALDRALKLVNMLECGDVCQGRISIEKPSEPKTLSFDVCEITRLLGITVPNSEIVSILHNLHIDTTIDSNGTASCLIPQYREDIERPCDIVEEIIRVYGYDKIKSTLLQNSHITKGGRTPHRLAVDKAKRILLGLGYNEIVTYSFGGKALYDKLSPKSNADLSKNIRIMNPLGEELSTMRTTLVAHMLDVVANNHSKNNYNFKLFEYGKAYIAHSLPLNELPDEDDLLSFCASERDFYEVKENLYDLFDIFGIEVKVQRSKKEFLHPGISVDFVVGSETIGFMGEVHPKVAANFDLQRDVVVGEINFNKLFALSNDSYRYAPIPKFPAIARDFALVVEEKVTAQQLIDTIEANCPNCENVEVFDVYRGSQIADDKKSVALAVTFRGSQTLKDSDIEEQIQKALVELNKQYGAKLR